MSDMIYVFMCAYNAEKTIRASLESIKNQTYPNWKCVVIDHGSTDGTASIIQEYLSADERFFTEYLGQEIGGITISYAKYFANNEEGYFITLDADDEYDIECFSRMIDFVKSESVDIAVCGSRFVHRDTEKVLSQRIIRQKLIIDETTDDKIFPIYHQFMRTVWGKLYSLSTLRRCRFDIPAQLCYGSDTLFAMEAFKNADKIGIMPATLHTYYASNNSQSSQLSPMRIVSDAILQDFTIDYLFCKYGRISSSNRDFIFEVYKNAVKDSLRIVKLLNKSDEEKIKMILEMVTNHYFLDLRNMGMCNDLRLEIAELLCMFQFFNSEENYAKSCEIFAALGVLPKTIPNVSNALLFQLYCDTKEFWTYKKDAADIDSLILNSVDYVLFLKNKNVNWLMQFKHIVINVLNGNEQRALDEICLAIEQGRISSHEDLMEIIDLGLNLSAELEKHETFVWIKKVQILALIEEGNLSLAEECLENWDEILPEDIDFMNFRKKIS